MTSANKAVLDELMDRRLLDGVDDDLHLEIVEAIVKAALASPLPVAAQGGVTEEMIETALGVWFEQNDPWYAGMANEVAETCRRAMRAALEASISKTAAPLEVEEEKRGAIAYALTKRLVIDMPTARAAVDEALGPIPAPDAQAVVEARARLAENLASFDAEVAFELANEGERADLWTEIDVNVEDLRAVLSVATPVTGEAEVEGLKAEVDSYKRTLKAEYDKREALDEEVANLTKDRDEWVERHRVATSNAEMVRSHWYGQFEKATARVEALTAEVERLTKENAELRTQDEPTFTYAFKLRAEAAEARAETAKAEAFEEAAQAICDGCKSGVELNEHGFHQRGTHTFPCHAAAIRSRAASKGTGPASPQGSSDNG